MWTWTLAGRRALGLKRRGLGALVLALVLTVGGCAEKIAGPGQGARVNVLLDLQAGLLDRFELTVTGPDMDTVTASMTPGDDRVVAAVSIPIGPDRVFTVEALDASGVVLYRGSRTMDVVPLLPLDLTIAMEPVVPMVYLNPHLSRVTLGSSFTITVNANDLQGATAASMSFYLFGNAKRTLPGGIAYIDTMMLAPEQVARGSQLMADYGGDSAYFAISGELPIVDEQGDGALVIIHCRTQDIWAAQPDSLEPSLYLDRLTGFEGTVGSVYVNTGRYRLRRGRVPESFLGGAYDDDGAALVDIGGGQVVLGGSITENPQLPPSLYLAQLDADRLPVWESRVPMEIYGTMTGLAAAAGGGFYACSGQTYGSGTVTRLDAEGTVIWRSATGAGIELMPAAVAARPGGGCFVAGTAMNDGLHYYLGVYDDEGFLMRYVPTDFSTEHEFRAVIALDDTTLVAAGYARPSGATSQATLVKFTLGVRLTQRWAINVGGLDEETAFDVLALPDGGFLLVGAVRAGIAAASDLYAVRTDRNGVVVWSRQFGSPDMDEFGFAVCAAPGGGFVAVGTSALPGGDVAPDQDVYVVGFDGDGNLEWQNVLGGTGDDIAQDVLAVGGGFLVSGSSLPGPNGRRDILLLGLDAQGRKRSD